MLALTLTSVLVAVESKLYLPADSKGLMFKAVAVQLSTMRNS